MTPLFNYCPVLLVFFPAQTLEFTDVQIISISNVKMEVRVASKEAATAKAKFNNDDFKEFYVGGIPDTLRER